VHPAPVEWLISDGLVPYETALAVMEARADRVALGQAGELVWLLEHPPLYTAGTSARPADLLVPDRFPVHKTGRGGQFTYHGPGQRIAYVMLDVRRRGGDVRAFVSALEGWIIDTLGALGVKGETRQKRVGVWVRRPDKGPGIEEKIAAIGIRIRRSVSLHGVALNVEPDLGAYAGIVPCGISHYGVTSLADLGRIVSLPEVDMALAAAFECRIGRIVRVGAIPERAAAGV
jgi:lipoyl(octanoyl) transferase